MTTLSRSNRERRTFSRFRSDVETMIYIGEIVPNLSNFHQKNKGNMNAPSYLLERRSQAILLKRKKKFWFGGNPKTTGLAFWKTLPTTLPKKVFISFSRNDFTFLVPDYKKIFVEKEIKKIVHLSVASAGVTGSCADAYCRWCQNWRHRQVEANASSRGAVVTRPGNRFCLSPQTLVTPNIHLNVSIATRNARMEKTESSSLARTLNSDLS